MIAERVMELTIIKGIRARKVFNNTGEEAIEVEVETVGGKGRFSAPSGTSKGIREVIDYPEGGIDEAIRIVQEIARPKIIGLDADNLSVIDNLLHELDGTKNFSNLGGNTAYAISMATAEAASSAKGIPLFKQLAEFPVSEAPRPLGNLISGGKHAGKKAPDIQEFLVISLGAKDFISAARANVRASRVVHSLLEEIDPTFSAGVSREGAWTTNIDDEKAVEVASKTCEIVSEELGIEMRVGLDVAASSFWNPEMEKYVYKRGILRDSGDQLEFILGMIEKYSIVYVEDPFHENAFDEFAELTRKAKGCLICGDDLFTTNKERLIEGIKVKAANSIVIKPNQVGTLTDARETAKTAKEAGYVPVASHRSGEGVDYHLAHMAVAFSCPIIKTGILGGERVAKLNELIRASEDYGLRLAPFPKL